MTCIYCSGRNAIKNGHTRSGSQKVMCKSCGKSWTIQGDDSRMVSINSKILVLDIETLPMEAFVWQNSIWGTNIRDEQIIKDWCMLSWSAKWLMSTEVYGDIMTKEEVLNRDDRRISKSIWSLVNQADIVIGHNAKKFDMPNLQVRWLKHRMMPPSSYTTIDTYPAAKKFGFTYKKLDYISRFIGCSGKIKTAFELWVRCNNGEQEALDYMLKYNKKDVTELEDVYLELRPWIKPHPNVALFTNDSTECCTTCGSLDVQLDGGYYYTSVGKYPTFRCSTCHASFRSRFTALSKDQRRSLLSPIAK